MSPLIYKIIPNKTINKIVSKFIETINNPPDSDYLTQIISINLFRIMKK